jgi:hypothetical protein
MTNQEQSAQPMQDPEGQLEEALIEGFLRARGLDADALRALPDEEAKRILTEASVYAATRLAEVDARAHYIHEIHSKE